MTVADPRRVSVRRESPLCGDVIDLAVAIDGDTIVDVSHQARACSLVRASAELLDRTVPGLAAAAGRALAAELERALSGSAALPAGFDAVAPALLMPSRRKCVLLPWLALRAALDGQPE